MKIYHTVNLVAEIDETKMPSQLLHLFTSLPEADMKRMLSKVFVGAITEIGALDKINEDNTYAYVSFVNN
jgi:hypothetical protein